MPHSLATRVDCASDKSLASSAGRRAASRILSAWLASTALSFGSVAGLALASSAIVVVASSAPAFAAGGAGGDTGGGAAGGAGGVGDTGAAGTSGSVENHGVVTVFSGGGGGAGGAPGGTGGAGGDGRTVGSGGAGGTSASVNGVSAAVGSGGGGGGGFSGPTTHGDGGNGGSGASIGGVAAPSEEFFFGNGGGGGGAGGAATNALSGGGAGGNGGAGGDVSVTSSGPVAAPGLALNITSGAGGSGGDGGTQLILLTGSTTLSGVALGGAGGAGGAGGHADALVADTAASSFAIATTSGGNGGNGGNGSTFVNFQGTGITANVNVNLTSAAGGAGGTGGSATSTANTTAAGSEADATAAGGTGGKGGNGGSAFAATGSQMTINIQTGRQLTGGGGGAGGAGGDANATATASASSSTANITGGNGGIGGIGGIGLTANGSNIAITNVGIVSGGFGGVGGNGGLGSAVANGPAGSAHSNAGTAGDGGAGAAGMVLNGSGMSLTNDAFIIGGLGGNGGSGGNGGAGGGGVQIQGSGATLVNSGNISGGSGGGGTTLAGAGGIAVVGSSLTLTNNNTGFIQGGAGGTLGGGVSDGGAAVMGSNLIINNSGHITGGNANGFTGSGGVGIVGSGLTINNTASGIIVGGLNGNGFVPHADAIRLTGGTNFVGSSGTIGSDVVVQAGSLMPALPGSTVGPTLNITGSLALQPGTTYAIRVNGAANDSVTATGGAFGSTVTGANVVASVSGTPGSVLGQHTIVTATFIIGTFAGVTTNSAFLTAALSYDPTHVFLTLSGNGAGGGIDFTPAAQNGNQSGVAGALNTAGAANGFSGPLITLISGLSASQARAAFTALDGEVATGAERASFRFMDQFLNLMLDPFVDGHFGNTTGGVSGFAPERQAELPPEIAQAYASVFKAPPPAPTTFVQRWSTWGAAFGGSGKTSGDPAVGSNDTTLSTYGFAGGIDYRLSPDTIIGFAAAGGGTNWGLANALGTGRSDAAQVGAYSRTQIGPAYIAESIAFANHWFSTNRMALGDTLRADFTGQSVGARIEGGYRFAAMPNFGITPYAAAQAQVFHSRAYNETDLNNAGLGLAFAAKNATDVRTELGARFDNPTLLGGTPLIIHARLAWAHDFVDTPSLSAAFQSLPLSNFTVLGAAIPQNSALASIGADWFLTRDWKLTTKFDGEFASRSNIYAGSVTLRHTW